MCSHVCNGSTFEEMGKTTFGGLFSFSHVSLWKELRPLGLVVSAFAYWIISLALIGFVIPVLSLSSVFLMRLIDSVSPNCIFLLLIIFYVLSAFYITLFSRNVYADLWLTYLFTFLTPFPLQFHFWLPCITGIVTHKPGDRRPVLWCPMKAHLVGALPTSALKWLLIPLLSSLQVRWWCGCWHPWG